MYLKMIKIYHSNLMLLGVFLGWTDSLLRKKHDSNNKVTSLWLCYGFYYSATKVAETLRVPASTSIYHVIK